MAINSKSSRDHFPKLVHSMERTRTCHPHLSEGTLSWFKTKAMLSSDSGPIIQVGILETIETHRILTVIGIWLFHCHIELHVEAGFSATFIEAPEKLAASGFILPADHINACKTYPMDYVGNAAGNDYNALNLTGAPTTVPTVNWG